MDGERIRKAQSLNELEPLIQEWQRESFPKMDNRIVWLIKWAEEYEEFVTAKSDAELFEEAADVFIVGCGLIMYDKNLGNFLETTFLEKLIECTTGIVGLSMKEALTLLGEEIKRKMFKNIQREWRFVPQDITGIGVYKGSH